MINEITFSNKKLIFNKKYPDGTKRKVLDNSIIKKLGWKSKISLNSGLRSTIEWYKKNYQNILNISNPNFLKIYESKNS